jgi:5,10-methylenetetrahydromethanopterin reductase
VSYYGEYVQLDGVELNVIHGRREPRQVPIYLGVTGPRMMALAGEIADGVILNTLVSPRYNEGAIARLEQGAQQAGRFWQQIDRPQLIVCSVDRSRDLALDRARRLITPALVQQPDVMKASGVKQELLDEVAQVLAYPFSEPQIREAMRLIPDDVVQLVTASGEVAEAKARLRDYAASGVTCPVLYPLGDVRYTIDVFADGYSR